MYPVTMVLDPNAVLGRDFLFHQDEVRVVNADAVRVVERHQWSTEQMVLAFLDRERSSVDVATFLPKILIALNSRTVDWMSERWTPILAKPPVMIPADLPNDSTSIARAVFFVALRRRNEDQGAAAQRFFYWLVHERTQRYYPFDDVVFGAMPMVRLSDNDRVTIIEEVFSIALWKAALYSRNDLSLLHEMIWNAIVDTVRSNVVAEIGNSMRVRRTFAAIETRNGFDSRHYDHVSAHWLLEDLVNPDLNSVEWRRKAFRDALRRPLHEVRGSLLWHGALRALVSSTSWERDFGLDHVETFFRRYFRHEKYLDEATFEGFFVPRAKFRRLDAYQLWLARPVDCGAELAS